MRITFLGTNGWYTDRNGNTTCIFIETDSCYIVLDAGNGLHKIDEYVKEQDKPIYLFLSHFHLDHISGLHVLGKFDFEQGMTICCPEGGSEVLGNIIRQPYTMPFEQLPLRVDIREMEEGSQEGFPFGLVSRELMHSSKCFGYRFVIDSKVVSYCTDTGYCDPAVDISRGADLLITECSLKPGQRTESWPHLNPEDAAGLAKEVNAGELIMIHFDAAIYCTMKDRKDAEAAAKKIFAKTTAARDGLVVEI
ncbi:MAG: MBL fold metallo-hydrolase [Candidatus Omnitrophica bacterium]|nr:MBL fold metallo-hydrolase [Candidatus Omnitrophota bacterium]